MKKLLKWIGLAVAVVVTLLLGAAVSIGMAPIPGSSIPSVNAPASPCPPGTA